MEGKVLVVSGHVCLQPCGSSSANVKLAVTSFVVCTELGPLELPRRALSGKKELLGDRARR